MTKEIALHCIKSASELERELCEECPIYGLTGCDHCYEDALQYVIKALEQEPILDKIKADRNRLQEAIKALSADMKICQKSITDKKVLIGFNMAVAILNKHLAESEDKE